MNKRMEMILCWSKVCTWGKWFLQGCIWTCGDMNNVKWPHTQVLWLALFFNSLFSPPKNLFERSVLFHLPKQYNYMKGKSWIWADLTFTNHRCVIYKWTFKNLYIFHELNTVANDFKPKFKYESNITQHNKTSFSCTRTWLTLTEIKIKLKSAEVKTNKYQNLQHLRRWLDWWSEE